MGEVNQNAKQKLSYEELERTAHQLSNEVRGLYARLQEMNLTNTFKRLDYLFKVVELSEKFNSDFVCRCKNEIEGLMTLPEEPEESSKPDENKN